MCRKLWILGLLTIGLAAFVGCSSSSKSVPTGDGSVGKDSAGFAEAGGGDGDGLAADTAGSEGQGDSARPSDGRSSGDLGRGADVPGGSKDVGAKETGTTMSDAPALTGDTPYQSADSRLDRDGIPLVDAPPAGADVATPVGDAPIARDVSDSGTAAGPDLRKMDAHPMAIVPVCDLGRTFKAPENQVAVPDSYGVCMPPAGKSMADLTWYWDGMAPGLSNDISRDGLDTLSRVVTCTELTDSGSNPGESAGPAIKLVIAAQPRSSAGLLGPQRLFAIYEDPNGVTVRAVYDVNFIKPEYENRLPAYPERYLRLSPACDSPDTIPFLKGWTGRVGGLQPRLYMGPDYKRWGHWEIVLWGSAEGEAETKALWFVSERGP